MIDIKLATVDEMLAQANILFEEHYEEIARNKQVMKLKPDEQAYRNMEQMRQIFIFSARQDDELIGYSVNFVLNHPHYADLKLAQNDLLFIKKEFRGSRAGLRLIKETEIHATSLGCKLNVMARQRKHHFSCYLAETKIWCARHYLFQGVMTWQ